VRVVMMNQRYSAINNFVIGQALCEEEGADALMSSSGFVCILVLSIP